LVHLQRMKNKATLFNLLFSGLVLFSILFQSFHSFTHLFEQTSKKICVHQNKSNQANLTHAHQGFDTCFVCHFSLSPFEFTNTSSDLLHNFEQIALATFFFYPRVSLYFKGSLFALRAPPIV